MEIPGRGAYHRLFPCDLGFFDGIAKKHLQSTAFSYIMLLALQVMLELAALLEVGKKVFNYSSGIPWKFPGNLLEISYKFSRIP